MSLRLTQSVFVHVPRTGGLWFGEVVRQLGLLKQQLKGDVDSHFSYTELSRIGWGGPSFGFIRHPLDWVKSRWSHAIEIKAKEDGRHFHIHRDFDQCVRPTFDQTLRAILATQPGIVNNTFEAMLGGVSEIYRTEDLPQAAVTAIVHFEEIEDGVQDVVSGLAPFNGTSKDKKYTRHFNSIDKGLIKEFMESEIKAIEWWQSLSPQQ